ncbi:alpha/beta hydrolase [Candidatus Nomurabacteria bacterium]|nr:alpha/beta hydrolase [Candidatus Nomurabacteria bacterium]
MKKQILFIHGGYTFGSTKDYLNFLKNYELDPHKKKKYWINWLATKLKNYEVLIPQMPCEKNAKYKEWKIWFEKYLPFIKDKNLVLIGHSLGAIFLLKYLSENSLNKKIGQLHLVAPAVYDDGLGPEKLSTFKSDLKKIKRIEEKCKEFHLWHSKDDDVCLFKNSETIKSIIPSVDFHVFNNKGHFKNPSFPEILKVIKNNS